MSLIIRDQPCSALNGLSQVKRAGSGISVAKVPRPDRMLTTSEAAAVIGINRKTLSRYVTEGLVRPTLRLPSGHMRWDVEDLKAQLRALDQRKADDE
jgi:hypothetical protein